MPDGLPNFRNLVKFDWEIKKNIFEVSEYVQTFVLNQSWNLHLGFTVSPLKNKKKEKFAKGFW